MVKVNQKRTSRILGLASVCVVIVMLLPPFFSQLSLDVQTWIDEETLDKVRDVGSVLKERHLSLPVFVFCRIDSSIISYYSNVIGMEIGQHYVYYGEFQFLISCAMTPTNFLHGTAADEKRSELFFDTLNASGVLDNIDSYPVVLITPTFYDEDVSNLMAIRECEVRTGVFLIPPRDQETRGTFLNSIITCYTDYTNSSGSDYRATYNWTIARYALEHYFDGENASPYFVEFPIYIFDYQTCSLTIRIFDAAEDWSPVTFYFDESLVMTYSYTGKMSPVSVTIAVPQDLAGFHRLVLTTEGDRQIIRLDIIVVSYNE